MSIYMKYLLHTVCTCSLAVISKQSVFSDYLSSSQEPSFQPCTVQTWEKGASGPHPKEFELSEKRWWNRSHANFECWWSRIHPDVKVSKKGSASRLPLWWLLFHQQPQEAAGSAELRIPTPNTSFLLVKCLFCMFVSHSLTSIVFNGVLIPVITAF